MYSSCKNSNVHAYRQTPIPCSHPLCAVTTLFVELIVRNRKHETTSSQVSALIKKKNLDSFHKLASAYLQSINDSRAHGDEKGFK